MSNEKKLSTLEEMSKETLEKRPNLGIEVVDEYLENLEQENKEAALKLKEKFNNDKKYYIDFQNAIIHTSVILYFISIKASYLAGNQKDEKANIDLDKYFRDYLFFARKDDKDLYDMRAFYFNGVTGEELEEQTLQNTDDSEEMKLILQEQEDAIKKESYRYDSLLNSFKQQYFSTKLHLL